MTNPRYRGYIRDPDDGTGVSGVTVAMKLHSDNSTVDSDTTDANGLAELDHDDVGYPGPVYVTATNGATTRVVSGNVQGQLGGIIWPDDIPDVFASLGVGVVAGVGDEFACTGTGSDRVITVGSGTAILKDGVPYVQDASTTVTLSAGDATNPRYDRIVLRLTREGQTEQGKVELVVIEGTPAVNPSAPALTQTAATWDLLLCAVTVAANVTTLSTANIASSLRYVPGNPLTTPGDMLYLDADWKPTRLGIGSTGQVLKVASGIPAWDSGDWVLDGALQDNSSTSWTSTAKAGMGSSPGTKNQFGNEYCGRIQQATGASGAAVGELWDITFANARSVSTFNVMLSPTNRDTTLAGLYVSTFSTTGFTISCANSPGNSTTLLVSWFIVDRV